MAVIAARVDFLSCTEPADGNVTPPSSPPPWRSIGEVGLLQAHRQAPVVAQSMIDFPGQQQRGVLTANGIADAQGG